LRALLTGIYVTVLAAFGLTAEATANPSNTNRTILSVGHTDAVAPHFEEGQLALRVKDDTGDVPVIRDPEEVLFHAAPGAEVPLPPEGTLDPTYDFLYDVGNPLWILPMTQDPSLLWPGWSSETIPPGTFEDNSLNWDLESTHGTGEADPAPGELAVWTTGSFGTPETILFNTPEGLPQSEMMSTGVHEHFNWGFGEEGLYRFCFEVSGTLTGGDEVTSGPVEYRFFVGDLEDLPAESEGAPCEPVEQILTILGLEDEYLPGDTLELSLGFDPPVDNPHVHWYRAAAGSDKWVEIGGGVTLTRKVVADDDGARIKAVNGHGEDSFESDPVTIEVGEAPVITPPSITPHRGAQSVGKSGRAKIATVSCGDTDCTTHVRRKVTAKRKGRTLKLKLDPPGAMDAYSKRRVKGILSKRSVQLLGKRPTKFEVPVSVAAGDDLVEKTVAVRLKRK
jgi:surface-anchored protein